MTDFKDFLKPYLTDPNLPIAKYAAYSDRYHITFKDTMYRSNIGTFKTLLSKKKFSGRCAKISNVSQLDVCKIQVFDTTSVSTNAIEEIDLNWGNMETAADHKLLDEFLLEKYESLQTNRTAAALTSSKEELVIKGNAAESINVDLTLPSILGRYSLADKEWFKWFGKDDSGNMYLYCKDKSCVLIPIAEGSKASIKADTVFWSIFWKNYRNEINKMLELVEKTLWELHNREALAAKADSMREAPIVTEDGDISALQKIHEVVPKLIMSRLGAKYTYLCKDGGDKFLKSINAVIRESAKGTFGTPSEENIQSALSTVIPLIDFSELQYIQRYTDNPYGVAIHRVQTESFKTDLPTQVKEVGHLPGFWRKFFDTKLGTQKFSSMYRIAKWITGCLDADNFSRKVLVLSGHGQDGKSLFTSVLEQGFNALAGSNMCNILPGDSVVLENNTQNGLIDCIDSRVIITPDITKVTDFLKSDVVKAITGCDTVTCQVKYRNPVKKNMAGTKVVVCTNFVSYISDTFVESRVSPIYFSRTDKGTDWDIIEARKLMLETFTDFVRWCYRFTYAVECEHNIPHSGDQPLWSDGVDPADAKETWSVIGKDDEHDTGMFGYHIFDEDAEIIEDDIAVACERLLTKDSNGRERCSDIREAFAKKMGASVVKGKSKQWKTIVAGIKQYAPDSEIVLSNGVRYMTGVVLSPSTNSFKYDAQSWANTPSSRTYTEEQEKLMTYNPNSKDGLNF